MRFALTANGGGRILLPQFSLLSKVNIREILIFLCPPMRHIIIEAREASANQPGEILKFNLLSSRTAICLWSHFCMGRTPDKWKI
jgi:hypothetical protein